MRQITRSARTRIDQIAADRSSEFDSVIISNTVHDRLIEDDRLRHVLDTVERTYQLEERDDLPQETSYVVFRAGENLNDEIPELVGDAVEGLLADLSDELDEWEVDHEVWGEADVREARDELSAVLQGDGDE